MKKRIFLSTCFLLLIISNVKAQMPLGPGFSQSESDSITIPSRHQDDDPALLAELVAGNNEFAFDLYHAIRERDENLFYLPYSISTAFAMMFAGARGNTEEQMASR